MQVNVERLSPVLVELQVQVPADRVRTEVERAYNALQRTARIKGFRPGKAPRDVLAHLYGGRVYADVAQRLVDETFNQALSAKQVQPLSQPSFASDELKPAEPFSYKARFEVRPEIAEVKWQGFAVKRPSTAATDAMIDAEVQRLRREHATLQAPAEERSPKAGDVATVAFNLAVDGAPKMDAAQDMEVEVGSGQFMKELEDALTAMRPGQEKDVEVTFSDRHPTPDLRGKKGLFHLTLKDVRERIFPEVDDELAKDCGEDSLEKLRASLKDKIERELKQKANDDIGQQLVMELCKANPIPVPPTLMDQQAQITERELAQMARRQGQRLDTNPELRAQIRADAEMKVRASLVMAEIAIAQNVKVTDEDIEKGYVELAEQTGKNVAKLKAEYRDPKKRETLIGMILEDKILDLVEGAAKVTEA